MSIMCPFRNRIRKTKHVPQLALGSFYFNSMIKLLDWLQTRPVVPTFWISGPLIGNCWSRLQPMQWSSGMQVFTESLMRSQSGTLLLLCQNSWSVEAGIISAKYWYYPWEYQRWKKSMASTRKGGGRLPNGWNKYEVCVSRGFNHKVVLKKK